MIIHGQPHVVVSLSSELKETNKIPEQWEIFQRPTTITNSWKQYDYEFETNPLPNLYDTFKSHWLNGIEMWKRYGQHALAHHDTTVCVSDTDTFFGEMMWEHYDTQPNNVVVFERFLRSKREHYSNLSAHQPHPVPRCFVTSYTNFMKIVSVWKWIDSHANQPQVLDTDNAYTLMIRTLWQRNLIYTSPTWEWV